MTVCKVLILVPMFVLHSLSEGCQWSVEAEEGTTNGTIYRDGTVSLSEGQYITWEFTEESSCTLRILDVEYINDGLLHTIMLHVDDQQVGSFGTSKLRPQSDHDHLRNESVSSGPIGHVVKLPSGNHTVKLAAADNEIKVDRITLALICTNDVSNSDKICQEPNITLINPDVPMASKDRTLIIFGVIMIILLVLAVCILCIIFLIVLIPCCIGGSRRYNNIIENVNYKPYTLQSQSHIWLILSILEYKLTEL